jgi:S1-C subfamily serine protease
MKALLSIAIGVILAWFLWDTTNGVPFYITKTLKDNTYVVSDRIAVENREGLGTGVWLDERHLLTNCHVAKAFVRQRKEEGKPMETYYEDPKLISYDGKKVFKGEILACDKEKDLALIKTYWPNHGAGVSLNWRQPRFGSVLYSAGYHYNMAMSIKQGLAGLIEYHKFHRLTISMPIGPGDSGSPVLNHRGELVALITAVRGATTVRGAFIQMSNITISIPGISIHTFLREHLND